MRKSCSATPSLVKLKVREHFILNLRPLQFFKYLENIGSQNLSGGQFRPTVSCYIQV